MLINALNNLNSFVMKSLILASAVFFSMLGTGMAQEATKKTEVVADIEFKDKDGVFDFGEIHEGDKAEHKFEFTNHSAVPLTITGVQASCGCTTPSWSKEPVASHKTGFIQVAYSTPGRPGPFNKSITITSNAKESSKTIYIKGEVIPKKAAPAKPKGK